MASLSGSSALPELRLLLLVLLAAAPARAQAFTDAELLLLFKDSFTNGADILTSWQVDTNPCVWSWVSCTGSKIVSL